MARSSKPVKGSATRKPEQPVRPAAARAPTTRPSTRRTRSVPRKEPDLAAEVDEATNAASEVIPEAEPQVAGAQPLPEVAEPAPTALEAVVVEALSGAAADVLASAPVGAEASMDTDSGVDAGSGAEGAAIAAATTVLHEVDRLRGMTLAFWQAHLERTMAAGQAIMTCHSPQAAMALQVSYLQASLVSGITHASNLARLSTEIARNIGAFRSR
jgi:hypothetical protein